MAKRSGRKPTRSKRKAQTQKAARAESQGLPSKRVEKPKVAAKPAVEARRPRRRRVDDDEDDARDSEPPPSSDSAVAAPETLSDRLRRVPTAAWIAIAAVIAVLIFGLIRNRSESTPTAAESATPQAATPETPPEPAC